MENSEQQPKISIHYEKTPSYRTVYTDGVIGGITPANSISLSFYATRNPIPKSTIHNVLSNDAVDPIGILSPDSKQGIIREIEVGVYMNLETARDIYEFLKKILDQNEK